MVYFFQLTFPPTPFWSNFQYKVTFTEDTVGFIYTVKPLISQPSIKQTPFIKQILSLVPKLAPYVDLYIQQNVFYFADFYSYKPLFSGCWIGIFPSKNAKKNMLRMYTKAEIYLVPFAQFLTLSGLVFNFFLPKSVAKYGHFKFTKWIQYITYVQKCTQSRKWRI